MAKSLNKKRRRHSIISFEMVRLDLISGSFNGSMTRLPSSRVLAKDLGISRLTVNLALAKLQSEGYLESRHGSGTFVAQPLPESFLSARKQRLDRQSERPPRLSNRVRDIPDKRA